MRPVRFGLVPNSLGFLLLVATMLLSVGGESIAQEPGIEQQYLGLVRERDHLDKTNRVLQAEVRFSDEKRPYLIVDLPSKKLSVRVHGIKVKEFSVVELRGLGSKSCSTGAAVLDQFEEFVPPSVPVGGTENLELVVELQDMPQSFDLGFQTETGPVDISIRPTTPSTTGRIWEYITAAFASGGHALGGLAGNRRPAYRVLLLPEDAQGLYWVLQKDSSAILICD